MNPESAAFAQILAKLQRPAPPAATPVARLFSNDPREHCLACRVFAAVGAQCRHCRGPYCSESCKKQDCQVHVCEFYYKIEASLTGVTNPAISRTFIIRHTATFEELHEALQIAFCWRPTTNYEFCMNKRLIGSADRIATLTMRAEEKARFDEFKDGSTTYIVEAMKNAYADRRILGYSCHASCTLVHCLRIRPAFYVRLTNSVLPDVRCILGTGHPYAEGFDLDEWRELKDAYKKDWPTSEDKLLIETYEHFCANADQYGLRGLRIHEFNIGAVNARLDRVAIGLNAFPNRFRRIWLGSNDELSESSLLEQAFGELSLGCMEI